MRHIVPTLSVWVALTGCALDTLAVSTSPEDFAVRDSWMERTFRTSSTAPPQPSLKLLYEDVPDGVTRGRSWHGTPFALGDKTYSHGLAFNATKYILVQLGKPGRRFTAEVGLENNDDTRRGEALGQGSVRFQVLIGTNEVFTTPVLRRKDGPRRLEVALKGAQTLELRVTDGGDGRGWDQALWAEAVVELEDGTRLRLQDLPWEQGGEANPYGFSFAYHGTNSGSLVNSWERHDEAVSAKRQRAQTFFDAATGLEIRVASERFSDFPAVEWVVYFTNKGSTNTPLLENILALDGVLPLPLGGPTTLHWSKGAVASFDDFAPQSTVLKPGAKFRLSSGEGRSSSQVLPFFNLAGGDSGSIVAIGWSGEWGAEFDCNARGQVRVKAGMEGTHLVLHPGETIRTPRILLLFYHGDRWQGQNLLRKFILVHHRPQLAGQPLVAPITCGNWGGTSAEVHLDNIRQIIQHQLPIDYYWIDAEWFGKGGWPVNVGDWQVKRDLYPEGFKPLSEALRASGRALMLWFEPERVYRGTPWQRQHPEWLLDIGRDSSLFNLGEPAAGKFLAAFITEKVHEFGLGCYRQDFNMDPLPYWRAADRPDRQGISEIKHIEGLYAFWDELRRRNPGLLIDNCASGGRRIDLETIGRATPFWRTDGPRDPIAHQCHTYGLMAWVPLSATSEDRVGDAYEFRSSMSSALCLNWWVSGDAPAERIPADFPFGWAKATLAQYLEVRDDFYGDYYPLSSYSQSRDVWMAYQLDRPERRRGLVVALRRPESPYETARLPLRGLEKRAYYRVVNLDTHEQQVLAGSVLGEAGLEVRIGQRPGSALVVYERVDEK
ncbi:MAG TPA: alpha-galactosidase [Verrucomicrobiae bacterium]|nr:alpha-galactosidase [Verrucomicrobiae bacterium]